MTCRICPRPDRDRIDELLLRGVSTRSIAKQCEANPPSAAAVLRHKAHLAELVAKAHEAREIASADTLLQKLAGLERRATALLDKSEKRGQLGVSVAAVRELRGLVELLARVTGELKGTAAVTVNILGNPQFLVLQQRVVSALEDFPEARARVVAALADGDGAGA